MEFIVTVDKELIGSRILNELCGRGYKGSAAAFYRTLARLRPTEPDPRVTEPFETAPADQCQFDWSRTRCCWGAPDPGHLVQHGVGLQP